VFRAVTWSQLLIGVVCGWVNELTLKLAWSLNASCIIKQPCVYIWGHSRSTEPGIVTHSDQGHVGGWQFWELWPTGFVAGIKMWSYDCHNGSGLALSLVISLWGIWECGLEKGRYGPVVLYKWPHYLHQISVVYNIKPFCTDFSNPIYYSGCLALGSGVRGGLLKCPW